MEVPKGHFGQLDESASQYALNDKIERVFPGNKPAGLAACAGKG